jgi:phenylacetate-CoA ligase
MADNVGQPPYGTSVDNWGSGTKNVFPTGLAYLLNIKSSINEQAEWLRQVNPGYVLGYPSALEAVAKEFEARGWRLNLHQVTTFGEVLDAEARATCERAFGVKVVDMYSAQEVGYIALQCPECENYHVQSENVLVEVLDDAGQPCRPGQIGKVVVTTLQNFAMPLIRYEIEDYAEVGECSCGRGLPVLKRILGRQRNLLVMPSGERRWPVFVSDDMDDLPPFFQFQVVQRSLHELDLNVVRPGGELTADEHALLERHFHKVLGYPFKLTVHCIASIPRSPSGKFEDFISLV